MTVQAAFFYTNDGMVVSTGLVWLQTTFDTLMELFDLVCLWTNVRKTVGMVCQPWEVRGTHAISIQDLEMAGEERNY